MSSAASFSMVAICTSLNFDFRMTLPLLGAMHYTDCPLFSPVGGELLLSPQSVEIIKFGDPGSGR